MILLQYKRNKLGLLLAVFCSLVFFTPVISQHNAKSSKRDLENKKKRINDEIREINSMLNETKASKKSSIGALVNINMKLEKRLELIRTINTEIRAIDKEIKKNEQGIEHLKNNLEKLKREYARMIIFAQRNQDSYSILMFIFAADNFSQAYQRLKYIQQYSEFRKKQAAEIIHTQTALIAKLRELSEAREEKNKLLGAEQQEKKNLSSEKMEQEMVLTELQKKEKDLKKSLQKKREDAIQLQLEIKRIIAEDIKRKAEEAARAEAARKLAEKKKREAEERKRRESGKESGKTLAKVEEKESASTVPEMSEEAMALSEDFSNNRGKLPWPVAKGVICETYGEHEHPAIKGFMMFNNGLEICSTKGTQARAVFDGEVTSIAISPTGGSLVIIRHGEYLSVYCNLEDIVVKTGQKVNIKQAIGTIKYDEDEGKTSMNLQIWKGQKTMDPGGWLFNTK